MSCLRLSDINWVAYINTSGDAMRSFKFVVYVDYV